MSSTPSSRFIISRSYTSAFFLLVGFVSLLSSRHPTVTNSFSAKLPTIKRKSTRRTVFRSRQQQQQSRILRTSSSSTSRTKIYQSSFTADGSEYSSKQSSDMDGGDDDDKSGGNYAPRNNDDDSTPTIELEPVPLSKNSGNRFVTFVWDRELNGIYNGDDNKDALDLHYDRIQLTEDHVMFCRKTNLYNETMNSDSMVDILWSLPILSSDLKRVIGSAMCLESTDIKHVQDLLRKEPIIQMLTGDGDLTNIPLYRWRHIRDYSLRIDDGRFGYPCMCLAMDHDPEEVGNLRDELRDDMLEYLIRSERVIAAGPLHLPTELKDDPSSIPVGDLILYNAVDRDAAIEFAEDMPSAMNGLYKDMRVHFYNQLDITGKYVAEDPLRDAPCGQMKEALEYWGYPVADDQTPWLNW